MALTKRCPRCKQDVPLDGWTRNIKRQLQGWCRACLNETKRKRIADLRRALLDHLGGCCSRCGFSDYRALQVDHIRGNGSKDPLRDRCTSKPFYEHVRSNRSDFQLLCANCNSIKRIENGEHGKPGRRRIYEPISDAEYVPGPGRPKRLQDWYDKASPKEISALFEKAKVTREQRKTV